MIDLWCEKENEMRWERNKIVNWVIFIGIKWMFMCKGLKKREKEGELVKKERLIRGEDVVDDDEEKQASIFLLFLSSFFAFLF